MTEHRRPPNCRETPDEMLMARYVDGDAAAFDELFRRYEPRAYTFFLRRTASPDRAQDLFQELFLRIHRARASFDAERRFAPWLFQIAHRLLVDDARRAFRGREVPLEEGDLRSEEANSEARVLDSEALDSALARLSAQERHILVAAKLGGVQYAELAAQLGKSVEAVRKVASRTIRRLRAEELLGEAHPTH